MAKRCQLRGSLSMKPVKNGDVWTFLNRIKREIETHNTSFFMFWVNVYLEPYRDDDNDNFLTLKTRGIGSVYNLEKANDTIMEMIIDAAEASNLFVGGTVGLEVVEEFSD